ncbi:MAG: hypothetical protein HOD92_09465 [Deltaproteobacteria bacterium]|nr:hypothetical protein [Deltaproteobacteria bacterium]
MEKKNQVLSIHPKTSPVICTFVGCHLSIVRHYLHVAEGWVSEPPHDILTLILEMWALFRNQRLIRYC